MNFSVMTNPTAHTAPDTSSVTYLPVELIRPNPYQPRRHFDQHALEELALSILQFGVLQPIAVRIASQATQRQSSSSYELIAGERRLRAAKLAGISAIPAIIHEMRESDTAVVALLENLQREDLSYMEEAEGYSHLINHHHLTQEDVALKVGKSQSTIANKIRLLRLPPMVKKMLADNNLTERHGRALLKLPDEQLQLKVLKQICEKEYNVKQSEDLIEATINSLTGNGIFKKKRKNKAIFGGANNVRIFTNTIKQAVSMIKDSGMDASIIENEESEYIEYMIRIKKM